MVRKDDKEGWQGRMMYKNNEYSLELTFDWSIKIEEFL